MLDSEAIDIFLRSLMDHYTATELVDALDLDVEDIIGAFYDQILDKSQQLRDDMEIGV